MATAEYYKEKPKKQLSFYKRHTKDGKTMLEHRMVAQDMIDRDLGPEEVVHHIDENKFNNEPNNLMVMRSHSDHAALHKGREPVYCEIMKHWYCEHVGRSYCVRCDKKSAGAMCFSCRTEQRRSHIDPQAIQDVLVKNGYNMVKSAKEFGISDVGLRKRCLLFNLQYKKQKQ